MKCGSRHRAYLNALLIIRGKTKNNVEIVENSKHVQNKILEVRE